MHPDYVILGRLVVAALLAAVLGWEREQAGKSAGLRTHMLVGIAAALYTGVAEIAAAELDGSRSDPVRAVQAVAMGIGFLGGGIIFVTRDNHVQGLTTAASIWGTAAMGIAAGLAHFRLAAGATVLLAVVLHLLARFDRSEH